MLQYSIQHLYVFMLFTQVVCDDFIPEGAVRQKLFKVLFKDRFKHCEIIIPDSFLNESP